MSICAGLGLAAFAAFAWQFVTTKRPAVDYAFQGTGFTLSALNLTGADLQNAGAGLVTDEPRPTGGTSSGLTA